MSDIGHQKASVTLLQKTTKKRTPLRTPVNFWLPTPVEKITPKYIPECFLGKFLKNSKPKQ